MLGYAGVHRRGEGDYVAAICTAIVPVRRWNENSAQWEDTGDENYSLVLFEAGQIRFIDGVKPDDFAEDTNAFSGASANQELPQVQADLNRPPVTSDVSSPVLAGAPQPTDVPDPATVGTTAFPQPAPDASPPQTPTPGGETTTTPVPVDASGVATPIVPPAEESAPTTENQTVHGSLPPTTP